MDREIALYESDRWRGKHTEYVGKLTSTWDSNSRRSKRKAIECWDWFQS